MNRSANTEWSYRLGAAVLAASAGLVVGLILGLVSIEFGLSLSLPASIGSGAAAGAVAGILLPVGAMDFAEGTLHFTIGLFSRAKSAITDGSSPLYHGETERPQWLRWALLFGVVFALVLSILSSK